MLVSVKPEGEARQKLGWKSEFQCLLLVVPGKGMILLNFSFFIKQWAYVYRNVFSKSIPNAWFFFRCSDFTRAGRSLLQALGSLVRMVFKYKAVMRAALNHVFYLLVFLVSWSRGHTLTLQLCLCSASVFSVQCVSLHCVELSRDFFVKDWNVFV